MGPVDAHTHSTCGQQHKVEMEYSAFESVFNRTLGGALLEMCWFMFMLVTEPTTYTD